MSARAFGLAAMLAASTPGCGYEVLAGPAARDHRSAVAAAAPVVAVFEPSAADSSQRAVDGKAIVRDRLLARGFDVVDEAHADPGTLRIEVWLVGSRSDAATRWVGLPWTIVSLATLGVVPSRTATEYAVEVHAIERARNAGRRSWTARTWYEDVGWFWLPFAFRRGGAQPEERSRAVHAEGLARAIDDALDEVLAHADRGGVPGTSRPSSRRSVTSRP